MTAAIGREQFPALIAEPAIVHLATAAGLAGEAADCPDAGLPLETAFAAGNPAHAARDPGGSEAPGGPPPDRRAISAGSLGALVPASGKIAGGGGHQADRMQDGHDRLRGSDGQLNARTRGGLPGDARPRPRHAHAPGGSDAGRFPRPAEPGTPRDGKVSG